MNNENKIIFFDAECNLCNFLVNVFIRFAKKDEISFAALQSAIAAKLLTNQKLPDSIVYWKNNKALCYSAAIVTAMRDTRALSWLGYLLSFFPSKLLDFLYIKIAQNRTKWFGKSDSCNIHQPKNNRHQLLP